MKKSLIALAALAASGFAMAQSSVTLFGVVDTAIGYVDNANADGDSVYGLSTSGNTTSRLGFRGVEDLGNGLKAGFWLEGEVFGDNGGSGLNFQRRSTLSLSGNFGEVRLGRDLTPSYSKVSSYDVFGQTGIGQVMAWRAWGDTDTADESAVRSSNMVSYYTANYSGFHAGLGYGFDEQTTGSEGRYVGGYAAYDNGPLSVALSYEQRKVDTLGDVDRDSLTLGASYDFGALKLSGIAQQAKYEAVGGDDNKFNTYAIGAKVPVGAAGEFRAQYALYDQKASDSKAHHMTLGYVQNLSKRTAVYGTVSHVKNKDASNLALQAKSLTTTGPGAGNNQTGVQIGVRHSF